MNIISEAVRYRIIEKATGPMLTVMVRQNWAGPAAAWIRRHMTVRQKARPGVKNPVTLAYLPKAGHTEDIMAAFGGRDRYTIATLDRKLVKAVFNAFLPIDLDDNNYLSSDPGIERDKHRLREFWVRVLRRLQPAAGFDAVFTGNYSYAAEQELAGACTELGVPFIALHKECMKTPGLRPFYLDVYIQRKNRFQGVKACSYNEIEAGIHKDAQICDPKNILVTGLPRLDRLHELRRQGQGQSGPEKPVVLFFAINTKAGLPMIGRKIPGSFETLADDLERLNTENLARDCYLAMKDLARENPGIRVIIKTKGDVNSGRMIKRFYGETPDLPPNLEIMAGGDILEIIRQASVVTSFNSTTLFEAMALNKPVVTPMFHEAADPEIQPYVMDLGGADHQARSPEEFKAMLRDFALNPPAPNAANELPPAVKDLLDHWCGNSDGLAGQRVREVLDDALNIRR